ncbi:MAG: DUF4388 domain-containing protein [Acidobacteria bacterium]|nr:DUF4388 domain-containing protein [Acidobacteriota bacterium]
MENIERTQFVVLTGHLDDQPLPDLIRTLRVQRKSGRLQVEYPDAPGAFFFEDGQLVDAQLGSLRGLEALYAALSMRGASFNFNPLVRPPERSIDRQEQKFITDLVEAPRREGLSEIKAAGFSTPAIVPPAQHAPLQLAPVPAEMLAPLEERLTAIEAAIISSSRRHSRERLILAVVISFLVGLTMVMVAQAIFNPFRPEPAPVAAAPPPAQKPDATANAEASRMAVAATLPSKKEQEAAAPAERNAAPRAASQTRKAGPATTVEAQTSKQAPAAPKTARKPAGETPESGGYVVNVLVEVKDGQVTRARVMDSRPSAGAYEAQALGKARQRRYPENFSGAERLRIIVKP